MVYTQQEINNFYSKYSCCFASLATDYTNSLAIGAFDCGQKLDKLLQFKSYLDILYCYKVDTCIIDQPEVAAGVSTWYFGLAEFAPDVITYTTNDGATYIGSGDSLENIVIDINNNTDISGWSAVLEEGGYMTITSPVGCFVKADLEGEKVPEGMIPATLIVFTAGRCAKEETCVEYTEEELNCITNEDLDTLLFWMKQQCLNIKNKPTITEVECVEVSENEFSISINDSITIEAGDSIEVSRNGNVYTITNPLPDLEVTIEAGANIFVSGTYPNFTISAAGGSGGTVNWGGIIGDVTEQTDLVTYLEDNYYPLNSNPASYLTENSLMVNITNADLLTEITSGAIKKGVIYRVTDATGGVVQVTGRTPGSINKAAYREGKVDISITQVIGIYGTYDAATNTFLEQGRIATEPTVNEDALHGYYVGQELKTLDTGLTYVCTDSTNTSAVWTLVPSGGGCNVYIKDEYENVFFSDAEQATTTLVGICTNNIFHQNATGNSIINDGYENTFYQSAQDNIVGDTCHGNVFEIGANNNSVQDGSYNNTFKQGANNITLSTNSYNNVFGANSSGFIFGNDLHNVTVEPNIIGADYSEPIPTNYTFLYGNSYAATIFTDGTNNYHRYYDVATDQIVITLMASPFTVSYIGGLGFTPKPPIVSVGNGTVITGAVTANVNTYSKGLLIPANSRGANDVALIECQVAKTGAAGNVQIRLYWNTNNNITTGSPILLGTSPNGAANWVSISRNLCIEVATGGGNGTKVAPNTVSLAISWGTSTALPNVLPIDWTQPGYLICAILAVNAADSSVCNMLKLN